MNELDSVIIIKDYEGISEGTRGVIVYKYSEKDFEVEFFDENHETIDVVFTPRKLLELVAPYSENR